MNQVQKLLLELLRKHSTHYIENAERGIIVDDLDVDAFLEEASTAFVINANTCRCCDGTGKCEGEHFDDIQPCRTCNGTGHTGK